MSEIRDPDRDQRLPVINNNEYIQDLVIADLEERKHSNFNGLVDMDGSRPYVRG